MIPIEVVFASFLFFKAGISCMLSFALLIISREKNRWGNIYLSLCFLGYTLFAINDGLNTIPNFQHFSKYVEVLNLPIFLTPVWVYLALSHYAKQYMKPWTLILSFLALPFLFRLCTFFVFPTDHASHKLLTIVEDGTLVCFLLVTACISFYQLFVHVGNLKIYYSELASVNLSWLFRFLLGFIVSKTMTFLISALNDFSFLIIVADLVDLLVLLYLAFHSFRQKEIFPLELQSLAFQKDASNTEIESELPTIKSKEDQQQIEQRKKQLLETMLSQKPYLNPELTLPELAKTLGMKTNDLSYFLNQHFGENFYGFVNRYRIEESKQLLVDPSYQHLTMLGIAMEAGFNSKTAFNTNFKKFTHLTPTAYKKANLS